MSVPVEQDESILLPLVPVKHGCETEDLQSFRLRTPMDADSPFIAVQIPVLKGSESIRQGLEAMKNLRKVFAGLNSAAERDRLCS